MSDDGRTTAPAEVKFKNRKEALTSILNICQDATWSHANKVKRIKIIAESSLRGRQR